MEFGVYDRCWFIDIEKGGMKLGIFYWDLKIEGKG